MIEVKSVENELIINLSGRLDSSNASAVEQDIQTAVGNCEHDAVTLDAQSLEYISSAGLRVILRLRKAEPSLKIVNASPEIYEIFDMTGFVEMMPVEKAYRRIDIDGCEVLGEGATGRVYRIDAETIVKYYFRKDALPDIQRERELARKAFVLGIPTAIPYDVVRVNDGYGSVFELLNADTLVKLIRKNPGKIDEYIDRCVEILKKFHSTEVHPDDVPSKREAGIKWAKKAAAVLPDNYGEKLISLFEGIEDGNTLVHGDFHIKNVMMHSGEFLLIDMDTLCRGNAVYEFAGMFNAYIAYNEPNRENAMQFFGVSADVTEYLFNETLKKYLATVDADVISRAFKKAALVGYTEMVKTFAEEDENSVATAHYKEKLIELINEVNELSF